MNSLTILYLITCTAAAPFQCISQPVATYQSLKDCAAVARPLNLHLKRTAYADCAARDPFPPTKKVMM